MITTPNQYVLNGLLFGSDGAKRGFIFIHGLVASAFSQQELLTPLAGKDTMVLHFSNRGHDKIAYIRKLDQRAAKGYRSEEMGEAHEVFTDCVDDIQGAINYLRTHGVHEIYLVGHSTGCQKSVYYLSQHQRTDIKGVILLCPVSDYAGSVKFEDPVKLRQALRKARSLVAAGKPHELLPSDVWSEPYDAQRFLSLNTPDSVEEIFTYAQPGKAPTALQSIRSPILAILAEQDEWWDRPASEVAAWFKQVMGNTLSVTIVPSAGHTLVGAGETIRRRITAWIRETG